MSEQSKGLFGKVKEILDKANSKGMGYMNPNKRSKVFLTDLKNKNILSDNGNVRSLSPKEESFRKGYMQAMNDSTTAYNLKKYGSNSNTNKEE